MTTNRDKLCEVTEKLWRGPLNRLVLVRQSVFHFVLDSRHQNEKAERVSMNVTVTAGTGAGKPITAEVPAPGDRKAVFFLLQNRKVISH